MSYLSREKEEKLKMPLGSNVRYRFKRLGGGKAVRLAFKGKSKLVEVAYFKTVAGRLVKQKTLHKKR